MKFNNLKNNKGSALIFTLFTLTVLIMTVHAVALSNINELNLATQQQTSSESFWLAEAAINQYLQDTSMFDSITSTTINYNSGSVTLSVDDSTTPGMRVLTAAASVSGSVRTLQADFPANGGAFDNTISTGDDFRFKEDDNTTDVTGKARLGDEERHDGSGNSATWEDMLENQGLDETVVVIPDQDGNNVDNEVADFNQYFADVIATYDASEVVHYQTNSDISIYPNNYDPDVKIIFVEATSVNDDQIDLQFTDSWDGDMLTIIATGEINYNNALNMAGETQLNMISYDDVDFEAPFGADHKGVLVSVTEDVEYDNIDTATFTGIVIARDDINFEDDDQTINFVYNEDVASTFNPPPGFEGLALLLGSNGGSTTYQEEYIEWREM